jgi:rsbT antagonist protein RsbS
VNAPELESAPETFLPIMRIGHCLFVIVPAQLRDQQARDLHDGVAARLASEQGIRGLVLDVSSLSIVDSYAAKVLQETAIVARAFGVRAVLVGLRPGIAVTLVELGIALDQLEAALTLERALEKLKLKIVAEA